MLDAVCGVGQHVGVIRNRDPDARLDDLSALMDANTPADLHRALVLGPPGAFEREVSMPLTYFRDAHDDDPAGAAETAMLLGNGSSMARRCWAAHRSDRRDRNCPAGQT